MRKRTQRHPDSIKFKGHIYKRADLVRAQTPVLDVTLHLQAYWTDLLNDVKNAKGDTTKIMSALDDFDIALQNTKKDMLEAS